MICPCRVDGQVNVAPDAVDRVSKAWIVDDQLCQLIEPLLPPGPEKAPGPRRCRTGCACKTSCSCCRIGISLEDLPQELGYGSA
jgi:hypothetical protein